MGLAAACTTIITIPEADYCIGGQPWKRRETQTVNDTTGLVTATRIEWSADGINWQTATPAGTITPGTCAPPNPQVKIQPDGVTIAGPTRAASPAFNGAPNQIDLNTIPDIQSVTVTAWGTQPGLAGNVANQIIVYLPSEKLALNPGETRTWSVERNQDALLIPFVVQAYGNAYAHVTWTAQA